MKENTKKILEEHINDIANTEYLATHDEIRYKTYGMVLGLYYEDIITYKELKIYRNLINKAENYYWDRTKKDLISVHRRIFKDIQ